MFRAKNFIIIIYINVNYFCLIYNLSLILTISVLIYYKWFKINIKKNLGGVLTFNTVQQYFTCQCELPWKTRSSFVHIFGFQYLSCCHLFPNFSFCFLQELKQTFSAWPDFIVFFVGLVLFPPPTSDISASCITSFPLIGLFLFWLSLVLFCHCLCFSSVWHSSYPASLSLESVLRVDVHELASDVDVWQEWSDRCCGF